MNISENEVHSAIYCSENEYFARRCRHYKAKESKAELIPNELAVSRKEKTITRSSVEKALAKVLEAGRGVLPVEMSSPKQLGTFGASYLYPVFIQFGLIVHVAPMKSRCAGKRGE